MEKFKTFKELGISFQQSSDCLTCDGLSCHNNVEHKILKKEFNVHISTNTEQNIFSIYAVQNASAESADNINKYDLNEEEAVKLICETFNWFKCS